MDNRIRTLAVMLAVIAASSARAATIDVIAAATSIPLSPGGNGTLALMLRNVDVDAAELAVWQVALTVEPEPGALGTVEISGFSTPVDYLFNGLSAFGIAHVFGNDLPSAFAVFSDALTSFPPGAILNGQTSVALINVTLTASPAAAGAFRVLLPSVAGDFTDSFWIDPNQQAPTTFGNNGPNSTLTERTIVMAQVSAVPEPCGVAAALGIIAFARCQNRPRRTQ